MTTDIPGPRPLLRRRLSAAPIRMALALTLVSVAGCSLSRGAPQQRFWVLSEGASPTGAPSAIAGARDSTAVTVGLRQTRVADYLATPFIVVRRGSHQVDFSPFDRWGEDLGRALDRALATRLAAGTPNGRIISVPWPAGTSPHYIIEVSLLRFEGLAPEEPGEGTDTGESHLLATWEILRVADGASLAHGTTESGERGWTVGDFDALIRLLNAGVDALASDLLSALAQLPPPGP